MKRLVALLALAALTSISGCGKSPEAEKISLAQKEVDCDTRKKEVVHHVVMALELQYQDKSQLGEINSKLSDDEFKAKMQKEIIPAFLEDKEDKKNTQITKELWNSKNIFEKIPSKQVPYASIAGTWKDNTEQEEAIWKIGKAVCLSL